MKLSKLPVWFLVIVPVLIAGFLRLYLLGSLPPSLTWDEAAWGYNGYSLLAKGTDEFGKPVPLVYFESFGDFKPPVYAYLTYAAVKTFGLSEFSTRLPSAAFGIFTVALAFFLVLRIFPDSKDRKVYAFFTALFLAISPWHINLSRAAFEANVATFFIVLGVFLFLKAIDGRKLFLLFSGVSFVISMYTFNSARIVSPLLVVILTACFWKQLRGNLKAVFISGLICLLLLAPAIPFLVSPQAGLRYKEVNIFSDVSLVEKANTNIQRSDSVIGDVVNNRRVFYAREYLKHYFDNLSPSFLFIKGDGNPKFSTQNIGQLYLWDLPFLIAGVFLLFKKREGRWYLVPLWLLISIVPAATARETPHALRIETLIPTFQILVAYGFVQSLIYIGNRSKNVYLYRAVVAALLFVLCLNVFYFLHGYFNHYARIYSGEWQYGYKDVVSFVRNEKDKYDTIYITDKLGRPYIYFLFYEKRDPQDFQLSASIEREVLGFVNVRGFDKYQFLRDLPHDQEGRGVLFVNTPDSVPEGALIIKRFKKLNGEDALVAYTI